MEIGVCVRIKLECGGQTEQHQSACEHWGSEMVEWNGHGGIGQAHENVASMSETRRSTGRMV